MISCNDFSTPERERLAWLTILISSYKAEHDWENDVDPSATDEMLREVTELANELEQKVAPAPEELQPSPTPDEIPL